MDCFVVSLLAMTKTRARNDGGRRLAKRGMIGERGSKTGDDKEGCVIANECEAIQKRGLWIASSLMLLAMTGKRDMDCFVVDAPRNDKEKGSQ